MGISLLEKKRLPEFREFIKKFYRDDYPLLSSTHLDWQFGHETDPQNYSIYCFWNGDNRLQGILGFKTCLFALDNSVVSGAHVMNLMVAQEKRNTAVGILLFECAFREHEVVLCNRITDRAAAVFTWNKSARLLGNLKKHLLVLNKKDAVQLYAPDLGGFELVQEAEGLPCPASSLLGSLPALNGTLRDESYLRWRYERHPFFHYTVRQDGGNLLISRIDHVQGISICHIVDIRIADNHFTNLMHQLITFCMREDVCLIQCIVSSSIYGEVLNEFGFHAMTEPPYNGFPLLFHPVTFEETEFPISLYLKGRGRSGISGESLDNWLVTRGDGDQDRINSLNDCNGMNQRSREASSTIGP